MNKKIVGLLVFFVALIINFENVYATPDNPAFTDDNFYKCVVDAYKKENNKYIQNLTDEQLSSIKEVNCENKYLKNVNGIEKLTGLKVLNLNNNNSSEFKSVNLSNNILLEKLNLSYCSYLEELNIDNNINLKEINVSWTKLTSINVSNKPYLEVFRMDVNGRINNKTVTIVIDFTNNPNLREVALHQNNNKDIDLSKNTKLEHIRISSNGLRNFDASIYPNLTYLDISNNYIRELNLNNNPLLENLNITSNLITNIDLSSNKLLKILRMGGHISKINLSNNPEITDLIIEESQSSNEELFTSIDLSNQKKLKNLRLTGTYLTSINLNNYPNIGLIELEDNSKLTSVNISNCPNVTYIKIKNNKIKSFDAKGLTRLSVLNLENNEIEKIDLYGNIIGSISATNNKLTTINLKSVMNSYSVLSPTLKTIYFNETTKINSKNNDYSNSHIFIATPNMKINNIKSLLISSNDYTVKDKNGTKYDISSTSELKTGMTFTMSNNITNKIAVSGDVTGTGTITVADVAKLYQYLKGKITMDDVYKAAGNVVYTDEEIKINDVAKLYQYVRGKITNLD